MEKAKTFIKFQRSLVQKAETVIDFETAWVSFYVVQHSLYFGEISCESNPTYFLKKSGFQHSRFLGFAMLEFFVLHSHTVGERVLRFPFRACDNKFHLADLSVISPEFYFLLTPGGESPLQAPRSGSPAGSWGGPSRPRAIWA